MRRNRGTIGCAIAMASWRPPLDRTASAVHRLGGVAIMKQWRQLGEHRPLVVGDRIERRHPAQLGRPPPGPTDEGTPAMSDQNARSRGVRR